MIKILRIIILILAAVPVAAQDSIPLSPVSYVPVQTPWESLKIDGKLKMQGLPLSPSLKIFLSKDSLIDISVRAPFVGEAGRMIINRDTVLVVNKMQKTFVKEGIADFLRFYPGGIGDIQNLLLARVFFPGVDLSQSPVTDIVEIYPAEDNRFNIVPIEEFWIEGVRYGFVVDEFLNPLLLLILPENRQDLEISAEYQFSSPPVPVLIPETDQWILPLFSSPYSILVSFIEGDKTRNLSLELKAPEESSDFPKPINLNKNFRQLSLSDFLRSF